MSNNQQLTKELIAHWLPKRQIDANKGTFGKLLVVAGSENYPGAAYLSCAAAYRAGAGLVTLATEPQVKIIVSRKLPEVTFLSRDEVFENLKKYNALLIGPGLGQGLEITKFLGQLFKKQLPKTIIDADGLNILAQIDNWWTKLDNETILTPHPGEMARLTNFSIGGIQRDRINTAQQFAQKWDKIVVLKGANTVIASSGKTLISPFANPVLATAGTGDILAGVITGLLAQGLKPFDAAAVGAYIHGLAGEKLRKKIGNAGMLASDLLPLLPQIIKDLS